MMAAKQGEKETFDYINAYEKAAMDVVSACGSREAANRMLDEIHGHYEKTDIQLKKLEKDHGAGSAKFEQEKALLLKEANRQVHVSIERYAPQTKDHVKEIILGVSLAASAVFMPAIYPASLLLTASGIAAVGGSSYISYNLLRKWKVLVGKTKMAGMVGVLNPKHVKLGGFLKKK